MTVELRGLGEYPGYYCYDPSAHPPAGTMPYTQDSLSEQACKISPSVVAGNIVGCLNPLGSACSPDSWINFNINSAKPNYDPTVPGAGIVAPAPGVVTNTPTSCPMFQTYDTASAQCAFSATSPAFMIALGIVGAILLFMVKR